MSGFCHSPLPGCRGGVTFMDRGQAAHGRQRSRRTMTHPDVDHYLEASAGAVVEPPHGEEPVAAMVPAASADAGLLMPAAVAVAGPEAVVAGRRHPRKNAHLRNVPLGSRAGQAVFVTTPSAEPRSKSPAVVSPPRICNAAIWREYWDGLLQDRDRAPASQPALRFPPPNPDTPSLDDMATEDGVEVDTHVPASSRHARALRPLLPVAPAM